MTTRTDWSALRTIELGKRMGVRLSTPAERVEADHDLTTMRFSRTLDERHPYVRSSQAQFVEQQDPIRPSDWALYVIAALVIFACVAGAL